MTSYHVNNETGEAGLCKASKGGCPFGPAEEHHSSAEEARSAYEAQMESQLLTVSRKEAARSDKLTPVVKKDLQPREAKALREYQGLQFDQINDRLREGLTPSGDLNYYTGIIRLLLQKQSTEKPVRLYRSIKSAGGTKHTPQVGEIFEDKAFMSCSQNPDHQDYLEDTWYEYGEEHGDETPCESDLVVEFELPKGSKALALPMRTRIEKHEQEVLLPQNTQIRIVERIEEKDGEGNPRIRLKGEFIPKEG